MFKGSGGYLGRHADTDDEGNAEFELPDRGYKFRVDWEGGQYWTDPITIVPHQVNEIDMDLDILGFNLTGERLYAHNNPKNVLSALAGFPYSFFVSSVIAAPGVSETIYYYHNDHLGTPQVLTDDQAQIVWKADYKPFGEAEVTVNTVENNLRFPGQYFDQETGLHYNYFRDYHPAIGRYVEPDPVGLLPFEIASEGINHLYSYVQNNPIKFKDSRGLFTYNTDDPTITGRLKGEALKLANCIEKTTGKSFVVTGGSEKTGHKPGSKHYTDQAFDMRPAGMNKDKVFCAALKCEAKYIKDEGNHWHFQTVEGLGGSRGKLPKESDCCEGTK